MIGPGRYDDLCTVVREKAKADGAVILVFNGEHGSGFSCQVYGGLLVTLPDLLERIAKDLRADRNRMAN
jgi:hypothetical protein